MLKAGNRKAFTQQPHMRRNLKRQAIKSQGETEKPGLEAGLYLVATPIGHAQDITLRALAVLSQADIVACEDTRVTRKLFTLHNITPKKLISVHAHNERKSAEDILAAIENGKSVAYVSDAGLPLISDPGHILVDYLIEKEAPITSIPGANAALTALQLSGLGSGAFYFAGFLPPKTGARQKALQILAHIDAVLIFYEAPHRLVDTLADMKNILGNRAGALARELTKKHEEILRGDLENLCTQLSTREKILGECVIVLGPPAAEEAPSDDKVDALLKQALKTMSRRDAAHAVAEQTGLPKRVVYQRLLDEEK